MARDRAVSLVELLVAALIAAIVLGVAYRGLTFAARSQKAADVRASRALLEVQLLETLMRDLRSVADSPPPSGGGGPPLSGAGSLALKVRVFDVGELTTHAVQWRCEGKDRIVRAEEPGGERVFDFRGLLGPDLKAVEFRLEAAPGELFSPVPTIE